MISPTLVGCFLGVTQGMCHALEPDHLAAVSTFVAEQRKSRSIVGFAAAWGMGHALVLFLVGGSLLLIGVRMPPSLADLCELGVAAMLVFLGVRALRLARTTSRAIAEGPPPPPAPKRRAAFVGMVHGLAGSSAIAALVVAQLMTPIAGLTFIALYGIGAALGMSAIAMLAGLPLARVMRTARGAPLILRITGVLSLVLGATWAWPIARRLMNGG